MRWDTPQATWDSRRHWDRSFNPVGIGVRAMLFKLLIGLFEGLSFADFLLKAQSIKVALTSEPALTLFRDPWPAVYPSRTALTTAYTEFETALEAAQDGAIMTADVRDAKRVVLTKVLKDIAPYLEAVA